VVFTLLTGIGIGLVVYLVMDDPEAPSA
jgi:hypothetical protein